MPSVAEDLTGRKFNQLTVVKRVPNIGKKPAWLCRCDCGVECVVASCNLKAGQVSCGCFQSKWATQHAKKKNTTHGLAYTEIYKRWRAMTKRCKPTAKHCRHNYYDRGIKVCQEWLDDPAKFIEWSKANGFRKDLEIDRIDNDKGYSPDNCRYATRKVNANNRRTNV